MLVMLGVFEKLSRRRFQKGYFWKRTVNGLRVTIFGDLTEF